MSTAAPDPLQDLLALPDPQERLAWITDRGRRTPTLTPIERSPAHRVPGCVSPVWLIDESNDGVCRFRGDAEAPVLRGLVALICARANGRAAGTVAAEALDVIAALDLERHLTPTRTHGLRSLQAHLRACAASHHLAAESERQRARR